MSETLLTFTRLFRHWSLGVQEHQTRDLFVRDDDKEWLWKLAGRRDDILVLKNAGKLNPVPIEETLGRAPGVQGVLFAGMHRWPACACRANADGKG